MSVKLPSVATTVGSPRPESRARCVPFHPTLGLAFIPTASLVLAFALAAYFNHLVLIPGYWDARRYGTYAATLLVTMALPTAAALAVIRTSYVRTLGPDPDPNGVYVHFAIDFFGMLMHVAAATVLVWAVRRFLGPADLARKTP